MDSRIRRRIDVDAEAVRAEAARGRDQDAPVAGAKVDDIVVGPDLGEAEHGVDHLKVAGDIGHVEPRPAADEIGGIEIVARLGLGRARGPVEEQEQQESGKAQARDGEDRPDGLA